MKFASKGIQVLSKNWTYSLVNQWWLVLLFASFTTLSFATAENSVPTIRTKQNLAITPITTETELNLDKVKLGKMLFNDPRLSRTLSHSCATCHNLKLGGTDKQTNFIGVNNREGTLNTPTILNSRYNFRQFWDGRSKTLKDVVNDHIENKHIFDNDWPSLIQRLVDSPKYNEPFNAIYNESIQQEHIEDVLEQYIYTLVTPNSPFDQYLKGNMTALSEDALKGYELFNTYGCISCHQGPNMGGNLYQKMGIYKDYFNEKHKINEADLGRFNVTNKDEDTFTFKVPSLRNIALTGPYLHDGSAKTLEEVVQIMAEHQVGQTLPDHEVSYIVKFLETLTGDQPVDNHQPNKS